MPDQPYLPGMDDADGEGTKNPSAEQAPAVASSPIDNPTDGDITISPDASAAQNTLQGKKVYLVDTPALVYQNFHAMPEMTSPRGQPVNAVFGFVRDLLQLLEERPDYLICAWDEPGDSVRAESYPEYKAHRPEMPLDMRQQMEMIRELIDAMNFPALGIMGYEADDVMATLSHRAEEGGAEVLLITSDKDCRQLLSDQVKIYSLRKKTLYDVQDLKNDWGIRPDQVPDFQGLVGDSVDNIPGVPLIGPKFARQLIEEHEDLETVLANADSVSGKKRKENLVQYADQARVSRELALLRKDLPFEFDWQSAAVGRYDLEHVLDLFQQYGFRSHGTRLVALSKQTSQVAIPKDEPWEADYKLIATKEDFESFLEKLKSQKRFSFDLETTHLIARWAKIVGYAIAWEEKEAYYVAVRAPKEDPQLDPDYVREAMRPILEDPTIAKVGQNLKYDIVVMRAAGVNVQGVQFDTMLASYLLEAGERNHNLDDLSKRYLNHPMIPIKDLIGTGKKQKRMDEVPLDKVAEYAGEDADVALRLVPLLDSRLKTETLESLFTDLELPVLEVLAEMEYHGIRVDPERLAELSKLYGKAMEQLEIDIFEIAGKEFNINSPKQLQTILFEEFELPVVKKTKTGPSTDASVLAELAAHHPLPAKIVEWRQYSKLKNTYVDALPLLIFEETGRVHASFNQHIAATGRLSSSDPNLQNIPVRTSGGREIRSAFLPGDDGWELLTADYSQIELRVLAHFSQDKTLCEAFAKDWDIHAAVASQVQGVPIDKVDKDMRRLAKTVNFGVLYGQSAHGLAQNLGISKKEAEQFIQEYFAGYPGVEEFLEATLDEARMTGYVKTILDRRRKIDGVRSKPSRHRNLAERTAINTVIQGSAADLIKKAMVAIHHRLHAEPWQARMLLQIHDELVFEVPPEETAKLAEMVVQEMTGVMPLQVPLKVDVSVGPNWFDVQPFDMKPSTP
ncbi:Dephospho-CoA kinase [Planctomycetales bacterium 10988]|nr:Dephospho-CoA kinase [Planctomycetales bacterium 10988]